MGHIGPNVLEAMPFYIYCFENVYSDENVYSEYFQYVMSELNVAYPNMWEEALELYQTLVEVNANGI